MFESVVVRLLEGAFVCRTSQPEAFEFLQDEKGRQQVEGLLTQIGRSLAITANGDAYYVAYRNIRPEDRGDIKALFRDIKHQIGPVLSFLNLVMRACGEDRSAIAGDVIDFSRMLNRISESPHLMETLRKAVLFGREYATNDSSPRTILDRLMQNLVKAGYLVHDRARDRFTVTGKIDYFYEVIDFLSENEPALAEAERQESLDEERRLL